MVRTVFLKGYKIQFLGRMGRRERSRRIIASAVCYLLARVWVL